jgi:hypothetical protein
MSLAMMLVWTLCFGGWQQPVQSVETTQSRPGGAGAQQRETEPSPFVIGYGDPSDPYVVAYAYPPEARVAGAAPAGEGSAQVPVVAPSLTAPVVYVVVASREKMSALTRWEKARPERLLVLPKPGSPLSEGQDADVVRDRPAAVPGIPAGFDGRTFAVPSKDWTARGYVVIFEEEALGTGGESGRELRCRVYGPTR